MNRKQIILLAFAGIVIARLLYSVVVSFVSIQALPEISAEARGQAIMLYVFIPLVGCSTVAGLAWIGWFILRQPTDNRANEFIPPKPAPLPPAPPWREDRTDRPETVITLSETDIELSIVLTGDAAKDPEGRKKIGAVMEHYGSGAGQGIAKPEPVAEGGAA